ncbi:MAG TPA: M28 family peptidase [Candidatus Thermoplasmatota archaeon]|jgi:hypothetical protein|nr:M28 family peptidase [Candidatus Thermoplasmatota archaeon]
MEARALALALALVAPALAGCSTPPAPPPPDGPPLPPLTAAQILEAARAFNGSRALELARAQVLDGARCRDRPASECDPRIFRVTGTQGNNQTAGLIAQQARQAGFDARLDAFDAAFEGATLPAHNVIATRAGATNRTLYLAAHYDTRPCADKDPDPARRVEPVLGANDGASGVAAVLEVARVLGAQPRNLTITLLFFDAEDMGDGGHACGASTSWAQGSAHHASTLSRDEVADAVGLVLLDMVGDADLTLRREAASALGAHRALQDDVWTWAARLGHAQFRNDTGWRVLDDHHAYQQAGLRAIDVIHLDDGLVDADQFPATHHTTFDDLDHLRAASLQAVGETVLAAALAWDQRATEG